MEPWPYLDRCHPPGERPATGGADHRGGQRPHRDRRRPRRRPGAPASTGRGTSMKPLTQGATALKPMDSPSYLDGADDSAVVRASRVVWITALALAAFIIWAASFEVVEVSNGTGKVVP